MLRQPRKALGTLPCFTHSHGCILHLKAKFRVAALRCCPPADGSRWSSRIRPHLSCDIVHGSQDSDGWRSKTPPSTISGQPAPVVVQCVHRPCCKVASDLHSFPSFHTGVLDRTSGPLLPKMSIDVAKMMSMDVVKRAGSTPLPPVSLLFL